MIQAPWIGRVTESDLEGCYGFDTGNHYEPDEDYEEDDEDEEEDEEDE